MDYREYAPSPDLARFVRCFWTLAGAREPGAMERVLPDGRLELVFHLGDPFKDQARSLYVGQLDTHVLLEPAGTISVFGVCFHPDGAWAFSRAPQHETAGRILPLADVWGSTAYALEEALRNAADQSERLTIAEVFLRRRMGAAEADPRLRAAVELIQREPWHRVSSIAERTGSSARQLERAFLDRVGCTPKTLARITRFQRVLGLREQRLEWGWARVAIESGYYDQAHLIADFRRFSGSTPALHQDDLSEMERVFLRGRR